MPFSPDEYKIELTDADILRRAKALICDEDHWFQGMIGRTLPPRFGGADDRACVSVAIRRASESAGRDDWWNVQQAFADAVGVPNVDVVDWNNADERVFADIHPAFDRAIALAETRAP